MFCEISGDTGLPVWATVVRISTTGLFINAKGLQYGSILLAWLVVAVAAQEVVQQVVDVVRIVYAADAVVVSGNCIA